MSQELIGQLRSRIEEKHQAALQAVKLLAEYLSDASLISTPLPSVPIVPPAKRKGRKATIRDAVVGELRTHPIGITVDELVKLTSLDKARIRGVLYAPALKDDIASHTTDGIATYTLRLHSRHGSVDDK